MTNQRTENRIPAGENGRATILGHPDITVPCIIQDFSESGLCILVEQPIDFGRILKLEWGDHFLVGRAQCVTAVGMKFRIGLDLLCCSRWDNTMTPVFERAGGRSQTRAAS